MKQIATLNKISPVGLKLLPEDYAITENLKEAMGVIVRSANMQDMKLPSGLLAIARAGAGYNNIPVERCAEKGIIVFNTPGANANAVKELVIGAMLLGARNILDASRWTEKLEGEDDVLKTYEKGKGKFAGSEIKGKTLGVIGLGAIGVEVANTAKDLGMSVIGYDPYISLHAAHELSSKIPVTKDLGVVLRRSDYITIHVPVNDATKSMIDGNCFAQMKRGCTFLNFARNTLVDEDALLEALDKGPLKCYITDFATDKVLGHDKVIALPHLGASTKEAEENCAIMAVEQMTDYLENGNITNSVNYPDCNMGALNPAASARICIFNENKPSMITQIAACFSDLGINIRDMTNKSKGKYAYTMIDVDSKFSEKKIRELKKIDGIIAVRAIRKPKEQQR